jgi:hypothetical protein
MMLSRTISKLNEEDGHAIPAVAGGLAGIGIIALGIGAANGTGWLCIVGGLVGGLGFIANDLLNHLKIDYNVFGRLEELEKK